MERHNTTTDEILKLMADSRSWLMLSHKNPDGDSLGCAVALTRLGKRLRKSVMFVCPDPYPEKFSFLIDGLEFNAMKQLPEDFPGKGGIIICLDSSNADRIFHELLERRFNCRIINIDHHADNELYGDLNWVDPTASATGEMVTSLMASSPWGIRADEAEALYAAIISDNGGFSFASTTLESHRCAITLLKAGASPDKITWKLNSDLSVSIINLWARALMRTSVFSGGECAVFWLTKDDFIETGARQDATENLVNLLLRIKGVRLAALCTEIANMEETKIRVSLRAHSPFNAREVAKVFGGGGHDLASGCTMQVPLTEAVKLLRNEMYNHVAGFFANQ